MYNQKFRRFYNKTTYVDIATGECYTREELKSLAYKQLKTYQHEKIYQNYIVIDRISEIRVYGRQQKLNF